MPVLAKKFFGGKRDLPIDKLQSLSTGDNNTSVTSTLTRLGWEGQIIAGIILKLSVDGSKADNGQFFLRGDLVSQRVNIQAAKLWAKASKDISLSVKIPTGDQFKFLGGMLVSEYVNQSDLDFCFKEGEANLEPGTWEQHHLGNFSIRIVAHLGKTSNSGTGPHIKYTVLAFPLDADQLAALSDRTQSSAWPGIKILEGQSQFFPAAPENFWGAPLFPLLNRANCADNGATWPKGDVLRYSMAAIMRTAALPTACTSYAGLNTQSKKILKNSSAADPKEPTVTWPAHALPVTTPGEIY